MSPLAEEMEDVILKKTSQVTQGDTRSISCYKLAKESNVIVNPV